MKYEDWYKEGVKNNHLKYYTLKTMRGLLDNVEVLKQACNQSVMEKLGKDLTDRMKEEGDYYWLNIQLDMMSNDDYWSEKIIKK